MKIIDKIILKHASKDDIFLNDDLIVNKVFFEYSSLSNRLEGPYAIEHCQLKNKYWLKEYFYKVFVTKTIYVPTHEESTETIERLVSYRSALPADLKENSIDVKLNTSFFLYQENKINGPYSVYASINPYDIKNYLTAGIIYVLDYASEQKQLNEIKQAS